MSRCVICGVLLAVGAETEPTDERPRFGADPLDLSRCMSHGPTNLGSSAPKVVEVEPPPDTCERRDK